MSIAPAIEEGVSGANTMSAGEPVGWLSERRDSGSGRAWSQDQVNAFAAGHEAVAVRRKAFVLTSVLAAQPRPYRTG